MRICTLLLWCLTVSLALPSSLSAQGLRSRAVCDRSSTEESRAVDQKRAESFIGRNILCSKARSVLSNYNVTEVRVEGSERPGTIVNQSPKPGHPALGNNLLLCISA